MDREALDLLREALARLEDHHIGPSLQKDIRKCLASAPARAVTMMPVPQDRATQDQLAAVLLLHGTPEQQEAAVRYASIAARPAARPPLDYRGALQDLVREFKRMFPIYYYSEPWAHERNAVLLNAELLLSQPAPPITEGGSNGS